MILYPLCVFFKIWFYGDLRILDLIHAKHVKFVKLDSLVLV